MNILALVDWDELLYGGFILGILRLAWDAFKFYKEQLTPKSPFDIEESFNELILHSITIQELITEFAEITKLPRILISRVESVGDGKLLQGQNLKKDASLTILYETIHPSFVDKIKPIKSDLQGYVISEEHRELLYQLTAKHVLELNPESTNVELVKQIAHIDGLGTVYKYLIDVIDDIGLIYLVIHSDHDYDSPRSAEMYYKVSILVQRLKELFNNIYDIKKELIKNL